MKIFNASFPVKRTQSEQCDNKWITAGIRTSCNNKRKLYLLYKENNNTKLKNHYKEYCKLLTKFIILAKKSYYITKLTNSANKTKTTWNIIKTLTNNQRELNNMLMMEIEGKLTTHHQKLAENFNTYYISAVDNIISKKQVNDTIKDPDIEDPLSYLYSAFQQPFTDIKLKNATTGEIGKL